MVFKFGHEMKTETGITTKTTKKNGNKLKIKMKCAAPTPSKIQLAEKVQQQTQYQMSSK